jgi:hypothetical protein
LAAPPDRAVDQRKMEPVGYIELPSLAKLESQVEKLLAMLVAMLDLLQTPEFS